MIELQFPLADLVVAKLCPSKDIGWPTPSPFNLRFTRTRASSELSAAISGSGLYLLSHGTEVIYLGMYRPGTGRIVDDRWKRHLQTITGRGLDIGFDGASDPERRRDPLLAAVEAPTLRLAIQHACQYSSGHRFKDTGHNTTPNRLRFASEHWHTLENASPTAVLAGFTFWLLRVHVPPTCVTARSEVRRIENDVLSQFHPVCNGEYQPRIDGVRRHENTVSAITEAVRWTAKERTGHDLTHRICLAA